MCEVELCRGVCHEELGRYAVITMDSGACLSSRISVIRLVIIGVSSDDNQVSLIKSISMSLSDITEMLSGIVLGTYRELMRADFNGGEVRRTLAITDECF